MTRYVALLRAVNVGGTGLITMEETRRLFASLGFDDVSSLGASGNILFSAKGAVSGLRRRIEEALSGKLGKPAVAILRSGEEMSGIVQAAPFTAEADVKASVAFLEKPVGKAAPPRMPGFDVRFPSPRESEVYIVAAKTTPPGTDIGKFLDRTLGKVAVMIRTWNVVQALAERLMGSSSISGAASSSSRSPASPPRPAP